MSKSDTPLEKWTFDELVEWATWAVIHGITRGQELRAVVFRVIDTSLRWHEAQQKKTKVKR